MNEVSQQILGRLSSASGFLSGAALSREFGMTRSAVWKHIMMLRRGGYGIEALSGRGYRLSSMTGTPSGPEVARFLNTSAFAREMVWEEELVSTNTTARVLAGKGAAEGLVVSADRQTGGRGRLGRSWESAPGVNIHCSLVLRPRVPLQRIPQLTLLVAVAIHKAIASLLPDLSAAIKWPNDIYSDGRKLAGVLCEMESEADCAHFVVVGIGINVNQESFPPHLSQSATSLLLASGRIASRPQLLAEIFNHFEPLYHEWCEVDDLAFVLDYLERHAWLKDREVEVSRLHGKIAGRVSGLSALGELRVVESDGTVHLIGSGEATLKQ
ncbi:biotin--[acetyl-CoA-carboxylase] ligase [Chlorobium phaeovibrioides]|uniref:Bifunctional ligase/repressor BirA n=2 Tax=Chlorobium phaeovibrioides TaxID=1094 RepID=A0A3S0U261_CHLPH|nr:biotin--[acetyl-CoA-carboxylase] ligase [Chlorobium phaeovibrioides]MWV54239.1 biotin--[acetyl-CoA-carboxylase] ligase [Chlorobium phaeovibrioides]RTY36654.1 biotin--[acetyl-CoA-carboxylase] ligase [Chlorobium phaeovibrioides]RTY39425.1 biotin--[acetyl-CoA-carboxylase] ligase [Chlorobium phaeovibrioides]HCD35781.1 biotin--[acetyl-CoA-carboxylase] ligase [Chlorobium sp.]